MNLRFYLFVFGVNQVEWGREGNPRFTFVTSGFEKLSWDLRRQTYDEFSNKKIPDWILWVVNFQFRFYEICVQNWWEHKIFKDPSWGLRQWRSRFNYCYEEYLFACQFWYCELCVENRWGGSRKYYFVNFCSLAVHLLSVVDGWWCGTESLI